MEASALSRIYADVKWNQFMAGIKLPWNEIAIAAKLSSGELQAEIQTTNETVKIYCVYRRKYRGAREWQRNGWMINEIGTLRELLFLPSFFYDHFYIIRDNFLGEEGDILARSRWYVVKLVSRIFHHLPEKDLIESRSENHEHETFLFRFLIQKFNFVTFFNWRKFIDVKNGISMRLRYTWREMYID